MLGTQPALNYCNIQRRALAHVQALHTSSSRAPTPTLDLYLSVPSSEGGESWRVPAKALKPRVVAGARDGEASQERASSQHLRSLTCLHPLHESLLMTPLLGSAFTQNNKGSDPSPATYYLGK